MLKLKTIINKVKEIDMNEIKEIEAYFKIIDKIIDLWNPNNTNEKNKLYLEIKILMDNYRKNYVKKES